MVDRLRLSRSQIAKIVGNDPDAIKQFEKLFQMADGQDTSIDEVAVVAGTADGKASQALAELQRIADALEVLAMAPIGGEDGGVADIAPPVVMVPSDDWLLPPARQITAKRYGSFYSTATQTAASANTAYAVTFDATDRTQGIAIASSSRITPDNGGLFLIDYALHYHETLGGTVNAYSWLRINGVDVTYSATHTQVQGNGTQRGGGGRHMIKLARGDYVEVMWAADATSIELDIDAASAFAPACPSARVTITDNLEEL